DLGESLREGWGTLGDRTRRGSERHRGRTELTHEPAQAGEGAGRLGERLAQPLAAARHRTRRPPGLVDQARELPALASHTRDEAVALLDQPGKRFVVAHEAAEELGSVGRRRGQFLEEFGEVTGAPAESGACLVDQDHEPTARLA